MPSKNWYKGFLSKIIYHIEGKQQILAYIINNFKLELLTLFNNLKIKNTITNIH